MVSSENGTKGRTLLEELDELAAGPSEGAPLREDPTLAPLPEHDLAFPQPIPRWDEALPLGNGLLGALVWGDGRPLRLSLDRADLWDLRPVPEWDSPDYRYETMRRWVAEGRIEDLHRLYDRPYAEHPGPTKIPAGRLELTFAAGVTVIGSRLRLSDATAEVTLADGVGIETFIHAQQPLGLLRLAGGEVPDVRVVPPAFAPGGDTVRPGDQSSGPLSDLGYGPAQAMQQDEMLGFVQTGWGDFRYAVCAGRRLQADGSRLVAWTIASTTDGADPWQVAAERVRGALDQGWERLLGTHTTWWQRFWEQAGVRLPNPTLEALWYRETYKFGAAARRGAPPISLQAVWTADEGGIPPWKGDYHHDLNTQLSYWPCYAGNHLEEGLGYLDWLWQTRAEAFTYTHRFFGKPGLNVPMTADLLGRQIGGWHQYTHSATTAAWLAQHFYLHWRYSQDRRFLEERAYPYLAEVCSFLEAITEFDPNGKRFLPLSSSPEINDNRLEAWLPPTSNYDLALLHWSFTAATELAAELGRPAEVQRWQDLLATLPDFSYADDGRLLVAPGMPLAASHRHFSHLMAIHPLSLIAWEDGEPARRAIRAALAELARLGPDQWCGYSYAWLASLAARAGEGPRAERALEIFATAFCSPNSFHLNGDQTRSGYSRFTYRPFTLEGNFAAAAGVQEMLLQSHRGLLRLFPALPATWNDVAFRTLRAEGAFLVSAERQNGRTARAEVSAEAGGLLQLRDPFDSAPFAAIVRGPGGERLAATPELRDGILRLHLPAGATITFSSKGW